MRRQRQTYPSLAALACIAAPGAAQAQQVPAVFVLAVFSPVVMVLLAGWLGWRQRKLLLGLLHVVLILFWVMLFALLSNSVSQDLLIWTPVMLFLIHSAWILVQLIASFTKTGTRANR